MLSPRWMRLPADLDSRRVAAPEPARGACYYRQKTGAVAKTRPGCSFRAGSRPFARARVIRKLESIRHRCARAVKAVDGDRAGGAGRCASPRAARAADATVTLNFVNADIDAVIKAVAEITGRNFVVDPKVKGTVNIVSAKPVPASLVYPTLLSALRLQGFAAVEGEGIVKIVPEADAKQQGGAVVTGRSGGQRRPAGDAGDHAEVRIGAAARQRPAAADHAQQHHRRLSVGQRAGHHRLRRQPEADRPHHRLARPAAHGRAGHRAGQARLRARPRDDAQPARRRFARPAGPRGRRPTRSSA